MTFPAWYKIKMFIRIWYGQTFSLHWSLYIPGLSNILSSIISITYVRYNGFSLWKSEYIDTRYCFLDLRFQFLLLMQKFDQNLRIDSNI